MAEFHEDPLWIEETDTDETDTDDEVHGQAFFPCELSLLPLSEGTRAALRSWIAWYDTALDRGLEVEWPDEEQKAFDREGARLWRIVADELGPGYRVGYFSEVLQRRIWDPAELSAKPPAPGI